MKIISDPRLESKFKEYPEAAKKRLLHLRALILTTARKIEWITIIEETLKWGEPSYLVQKGSTIRMDWKEGTPDQYALYFKCTSKLVPTFKAVYGDKFRYENNRAILFKLDEALPEAELSHCISLALTYHTVKHLPFLGVQTA